jgi:hypothetical protein
MKKRDSRRGKDDKRGAQVKRKPEGANFSHEEEQ